MKNLNLPQLCLIVLMFSVGAASAQEPFEQKSFVISPSEIGTNRNAPADYDAKFKQNDRAIVYSAFGLAPVRVVAKAGSIYKVNYENAPSQFGYYRANAVYPYFDADKYEKLVRANEEVIAPFLNCYAKKHNLRSVGDFGWRHDQMTVETIKERLELGTPKMEQLERDLKSQLPVRPNTFEYVEKNPAVLDEIVSNLDEYARCVVGKKESSKFDDSVWLSAHRDGIKKALKDVNEYDPATKTTMGTDSEYALYAVSPKARMKWLTDTKSLEFKEAVNDLLAPLAAALNKKLPDYPPPLKYYAIRNPSEEALMKRALGNPARYKIFSAGLMSGSWKIETNNLGIPISRYKYGMIYVRDTTADHPYCHAAFVNVVQSYAGGGTYAASRGVFAGESLVACPAGK